MREMRLFKLAMAMALVALAALLVRYNLSDHATRRLVNADDLASANAIASDQPAPNVDLTPAQVVRIQVEALRRNDDTDSGILTAFRFASPTNRRMTGPIEHFIQIVKSPIYQPLLHNVRVECDPVQVERDRARATVRVYDPAGHMACYIFLLGMQKQPGVLNCWMTEGVLRVPSPDDEQQQQRRPAPSSPAPPASEGVQI